MPREEWSVENAVMVQAAHPGMGTEVAHLAFGRHAAQALRAVEQEAQRLERLLSRFLQGSDVDRINRSAGVKYEAVSPETFAILSCATECSRISGGRFDPTIGPLLNLWDYKNASSPPAEERIAKVLPLVNYRDLELCSTQKTAGLKKAGQSIDLGGIGKGFASDRFMELFRAYGVTSACSNIGGNVSTLGSKPDGSLWRVGIRHPRKDGLVGAVAVTGKSVVTSGDYERYFFDSKGRRFHHILSPITGYPADAGLLSVTVVADSAMVADAVSTAVFVAGLESGLIVLEPYQAEAVLVDAELRVYVTRGLRGRYQAGAGITRYI